MKKVIITLALVVGIALNACDRNNQTDNISVSTKVTHNHLNFTAHYPEQKTMAAQNYIEDYFKEQRIFKALNDVKKIEIRLTDGTHFYLNYEPGFIEIQFERDKNSSTAYNRVKKMIDGFGNALKD